MDGDGGWGDVLQTALHFSGIIWNLSIRSKMLVRDTLQSGPVFYMGFKLRGQTGERLTEKVMIMSIALVLG